MWALSGSKPKASLTTAFWIDRTLSPFLALALSDAALRRIGLLLIFVKIFIRASESAVELWIKSSSFLGLRIVWNICICKVVGRTKTTYSAVMTTSLSGKLTEGWSGMDLLLGGKWFFNRVASRRRTKLFAIMSSCQWDKQRASHKMDYKKYLWKLCFSFLNFLGRCAWGSTLQYRRLIHFPKNVIVVWSVLWDRIPIACNMQATHT